MALLWLAKGVQEGADSDNFGGARKASRPSGFPALETLMQARRLHYFQKRIRMTPHVNIKSHCRRGGCGFCILHSSHGSAALSQGEKEDNSNRLSKYHILEIDSAKCVRRLTCSGIWKYQRYK